MSNFKENLNAIIRAFDGNQRRAAEFIGISDSQVSKMLSSENPPSRPVVELLAMKAAQCENPRPAVESVSAASPLSTMGLRRVPIVSMAQAGAGKDYQDMANQIDESVPTDSRDPNAFAVIIEGDSMEPTYFAGDIAICNPNSWPTNGTLALIRLETGETLLKWWFPVGERGEQVRLGSENKAKYRPKLYATDEIVWAYRVHQVIKQPQTRRAQDFIPQEKDEQDDGTETRNE